MSLQSLLSRPVTILTAGSVTDRYGDRVQDWSAPTERTSKAWFAQQNTTNERAQRDGLTIEGHALFPLDSHLAPRERVVIDGVTFDVVGEPNVAPTPRGPHHIEADLRRMAG